METAADAVLAAALPLGPHGAGVGGEHVSGVPRSRISCMADLLLARCDGIIIVDFLYVPVLITVMCRISHTVMHCLI